VHLLVNRKDGALTIIVLLIVVVILFGYFNNGSGTLEIRIHDQISDYCEATQIYLNYSAIEVHRAQEDNESGWVKVVDGSTWINLTENLDVNRTICYANLQAGEYNLIRFRVLDAHITIKGVNYTASVLNGELQSAINSGMRLNTGQTVTLLIDIGVKVQSTEASGSFILIPVVKVIPI
jgi:hypothetical protein